jgi:hypothetical protein
MEQTNQVDSTGESKKKDNNDVSSGFVFRLFTATFILTVVTLGV